MENQVLTIPQMQELIDMGIDVSNASCCWCKVQAPNREGFDWMLLLEHLNKCDTEHTPTFTFQDILEMFSQGSLQGSLHFNKNKFIVFVADNQFNVINEEDSVSPIEAAFKMLKWCKENNYI